MILVELIQHLVNTAVYTCGEPNDYCPLCFDQGGMCPATAVTSIAAAFATQGYWVQADMLDMLTFSNMSAIGPLLYVCAAIAGLIGVALGQPPRIYMWFFLGPALYGWLLDTRQEITGVQWQIGQMQQDQREVWKQAEVGLLNTNMAKRLDLYGDGSQISSTEPPHEVMVSTFFIWYDSLLSSVINGLIEWTGAYSQNQNGDGLVTSTNVGSTSWIDASSQQEDRWFLLSNLKWGMLENVTSAKITSPALRDAFATFIGGICGEQMTKAIDEGAFASAAHADGMNLPSSVFKRGGATSAFDDMDNSMTLLARKLREYEVEYSDNLRKLFTAPDDRMYYLGPVMPGAGGLGYASPVGSFENAVSWGPAQDWIRGSSGSTRETLRCDTYLYLMTLAFRWEAGHIFSQIVANAPELASYNEDKIDYNDQARKLVRSLFYGWNIKSGRALGDPNTGSLLTEKQYKNFLLDLILVHLIKNEFALVTQPVDVRYTGTYLAKNYTEGQQRTVGQKSKFGEVYSWARLMPYLQGVLLYYLAIGYPFACIMMLIPGWHKTLFTWMSFWAWVKLWDLGFALVMSIERSVWAMIGNSSQAAGLHDRVLEMQNWGGVTPNPPPDFCGSSVCTVWEVILNPSGLLSSVQGFDYANMLRNFRILDRAMTIGPSLDLDLSNSYYIYIMSALYFAVPAVTGQLVLGAKAGAASMLTSAMSQVAGEAGRAAGSGYSGDLTQRLKSNANSIGQASAAGYLQKSGLAASALQAGNYQTDAGIRGSELGAWKETVDNQVGANQATAGQWGNMTSAMRSAANVGQAITQLPNGGGGGASNVVNTAFGAAMDKVGAGKSIQAAQAQKEGYAAKQNLNAEGFRSGAMANAFGRNAGLKQNEAQFGADMARWNSLNRMANQLGGAAAAMGVQAGMMDPGAKPMNMEAMALRGALGSGAKEAASKYDWWRGGSAFGGINNAANQVGAQKTDTSAPVTPQQVWGQALSDGGGVLQTAVAGSNAGLRDSLAQSGVLTYAGTSTPLSSSDARSDGFMGNHSNWSFAPASAGSAPGFQAVSGVLGYAGGVITSQPQQGDSPLKSSIDGAGSKGGFTPGGN